MLFNSPLGLICVTSENEKICSVSFVDEPIKVKEKISLPKDKAIEERCIQQLSDYFFNKRRNFTFPFHQNGTSFQERVWLELEKIPYGHTISYLQLSRQIGDVKAIRAAASANGKNNLAIIVPCHRVIGSNGALTGYASGIWRKKWLLEHEAKYCTGVQVLF